MANWKFITVEKELTVVFPAYTALDVVGGLLTFNVPAIVNGGILDGVSLIDEDNQQEEYLLYLHDELPATIADADEYTVAIADLRKQFAVVTLAAANYVTVNSLAYIHVRGLDYAFQTDGSSNIHAYLQAVATPDYVNVDALLLRLHIRTIG